MLRSGSSEETGYLQTAGYMAAANSHTATVANMTLLKHILVSFLSSFIRLKAAAELFTTTARRSGDSGTALSPFYFGPFFVRCFNPVVSHDVFATLRSIFDSNGFSWLLPLKPLYKKGRIPFI